MNWLTEKRQSVKKEWYATTGYFSLQSKIWLNQRAQKAGKLEPYTGSPFDRIRQPKPRWVGVTRGWRKRFANLPSTVRAAAIAFTVIFFIVVFAGAPFDWSGVTTELWGLLAEVFVLGIVIFYVGEKSQASQFIARQHELISDFRYWDSEEAKFRILGAIRRLQEKGVSTVNIAGVTLSSASLKEHGVTKLDGSVLSGGHWASSIGIRTTSNFEKVDFAECALRGVRFSMGDGLGFFGTREFQKPQASYIDCNFFECDMTGASFEQAELKSTVTPPVDTHEHIADDEKTGQPIFQQTHYGEFYNADLSNVSFKNAWLKNVDFRDAEGIEAAEFYGARGLESCVFQNDELKQSIIAKAKEQPDA